MTRAMQRLEPFVGTWQVEASIAPPGMVGAATFAWVLGGRFLLQRAEIPHPEAPDGLCVIGAAEDEGRYVQHYFDSRGIARVYAMTFDDGVWRLWRDAPDFTPLPFHQRFAGTFSDDGDRIEGAWEHSPDGAAWELDFDLTYTRVPG